MGTIGAVIRRGVSLPPDVLVDVLLDFGSWNEWFGLHAGWPRGAPEALAEGDEFVQRVVIYGIADDVTWTVTRLAMPLEFAMTGRGSYRSTVRLRFVLEPEPTPMLTLEFDGSGPWAAPGPLKRRAISLMETEMELYLHKLELHTKRARLGMGLTPDEERVLTGDSRRPTLIKVASAMLGIADTAGQRTP